MATKGGDDNLQQVLERAQVALQEAIDSLSSGQEAGSIDAGVGIGDPGGGGGVARLGLPGDLGRMNIAQLLSAKRLGKAGFDSQLAGVNLACDEGC